RSALLTGSNRIRCRAYQVSPIARLYRAPLCEPRNPAGLVPRSRYYRALGADTPHPARLKKPRRPPRVGGGEKNVRPAVLRRADADAGAGDGGLSRSCRRRTAISSLRDLPRERESRVARFSSAP